MCSASGEYFVLDRIEQGLYVLISDGGARVVTSELPGDPREGDVFTRREGAFVFCPDEREARERRVEQKMRDLFDK